MIKMNEFKYHYFVGNNDKFVVSKQIYNKQEAIDMAKSIFVKKDGYLAMCNGYVRHTFGINQKGKLSFGWWLEGKERKRSCPCYVFHYTKNKVELENHTYEYIALIK